MILFDSRDSGGLEKWSVARGEAKGDRPRLRLGAIFISTMGLITKKNTCLNDHKLF